MLFPVPRVAGAGPHACLCERQLRNAMRALPAADCNMHGRAQSGPVHVRKHRQGVRHEGPPTTDLVFCKSGTGTDRMVAIQDALLMSAASKTGSDPRDDVWLGPATWALRRGGRRCLAHECSEYKRVKSQPPGHCTVVGPGGSGQTPEAANVAAGEPSAPLMLGRRP